MHKHFLTPSPKYRRSVQPKSEAWSVQKSSLTRLGPGPQSLLQTQKVEVGAHSGTSMKKGKKKVVKPVSSFVIQKMKTNLETDTQELNSKLQGMLAPVKSLNHKVPRVSHPSENHGPHEEQNHEGTVAVANHENKIHQKMDLGLGLMPPPTMGEKLITVGGYIISLQSTREDISTVVKPRVSTDKEGLEAEIKIMGCPPSDIRFEKRYDTLIVIGVANPNPPPAPLPPIERRSTFHGERTTSHDRVLTRLRGLSGSRANADLHHTGTSIVVNPETIQLDEIHEVVNIFVPKNVSVNQIFISTPDAKGRIFVKGP